MTPGLMTEPRTWTPADIRGLALWLEQSAGQVWLAPDELAVICTCLRGFAQDQGHRKALERIVADEGSNDAQRLAHIARMALAVPGPLP